MSIKLLSSLPSSMKAPESTFEGLPTDPYLKGSHAYRKRAYSHGEYLDGRIQWLPSNFFLQSKDLNTYAGGIERTFADLSQPSCEYIESVITFMINHEHLNDTAYTIGCHQIRIVATDEFNGYPAPEGFHQDGFDYVAVICVDQENINGGFSLVRPISSEKAISELQLQPGQIMLINDREVEHYVTPITPKIPGQAHRDVFVITFKEKEVN